MTSFAFILGCVPLWTATGAGSVARQIMGTTVIGGMLAGCAIGIFFIPAMFYLVEKWSGAGKEPVSGALPAPAEADLNALPRERREGRTAEHAETRAIHVRPDGFGVRH